MAAKFMRAAHATSFMEKAIDLSHYTEETRKQSRERIALSVSHADEGIESVISKDSSRSVLIVGPTTPKNPDPDSGPPVIGPMIQRNSVEGGTGDIDGLISQLDRTRIQTAAPSTSRNIPVPKGFQLGMAFNVANFYDLRSDFRRFDKRKRDLGILPQSTRRQKHGFRPEELLWYGAIDLKDCKGSNLTNEIHPLLRQDHFDDTPDHIYDQLVAGLRLATFFLSHPVCMQFWVTLAKGERRVDHEMSRRCGNTQHRISRNVPMTEENVSEVIQYVKDLGHAKAVHFTFTPGLAFEGDAAFGTARTVCDFQSEDSGCRRHGDLQRSNIRLHSDFYIIAKKLSSMKYPDTAQKLRFNFIFATLIVHEMAHAIELSQWKNRAPSPYEPFMLHHNKAELGRMWESYVFGGQVAPINDRVDGIYGVATWNWPRSFGEMDPERTICHALPMKYIEKLQQMETWESEYDLSDGRAFHVPRDGATSIYMNSVTTVSWTEEERVAKEALQEQQLQNLEEPARKKRETADGHAVAIKDSVAEPEAVETPTPHNEKGTIPQVHRVKREPRSVLSRKKRRAQKKVEQKSLEKEQATSAKPNEVETKEGVTDKIDPSTPGEPSDVTTRPNDNDRVTTTSEGLEKAPLEDNK
ncbi:MAG: hypothetical protein LQ338_003667 [Usnochroma carphineum]|nr:MAG: hypothetical protein LQ338_003667 [Usnochroma carphineum]